MPALPAATDFTGATVTEGQFKTAITNLRAYLAAARPSRAGRGLKLGQDADLHR